MSFWSEFAASHLGWRWLCLAMAAILLAVTTVVLARFRVIQSRPLSACVILSFFAHVLLFLSACFFDLFEVPNMPAGTTLHMRLTADLVETEQLQVPVDLTEPPELQPESPDAQLFVPEPPIEEPLEETIADIPSLMADTLALPEPDTSDRDAANPLPVEPLTAPPLLEVPFAENESSIADVEPSGPPTEPTAALLDSALSAEPAPIENDSADIVQELAESTPVESDSTQVSRTDQTTEEEWVPLATPPQDLAASNDVANSISNAESVPEFIPSRLSHRLTEDRQQRLARYGGNADTERAVRDALGWLARHQASDGRWVAREYGAGTAEIIDHQDRRGIGISADTGVSGLALLAFLGAGHTSRHGEYQQEVRRGLEFLSQVQASNGDLAGHADPFARTYCHGIALLALGEAYTLTGERHWKSALVKGMSYSEASQNHATGGWRYQPGDMGDASQFGWQVMALMSGRQAGVPLQPATAPAMEQFLRSVSSGQYGGLAAYRHFLPPTAPMTAECLVCRLLLREEDSPAVREGVQSILAKTPEEPLLNLYYCYYGSLALHLADAPWQPWNDRMQAAILARQVKNGDQRGSWNLDTVWGRCGGRVYTTAIAALALEVYYRYTPIVDRSTARR